MPIKPKFKLTSTPLTAQRFFTDRESPRKIFAKNVVKFDPNQYSIINYYGMGGIGKSRLVKVLKNELTKYPKWQATELDFAQVSHRNSSNGLLEIRNQLRNSITNIKFTSFDFAYAVYWQKLNPGIELSKKGLSHLENSDLVNDIAKEVFDGLEAIPGLNIVPKIAMLAEKASSAIGKWWLKRGCKQHENLQSLSLEEIQAWLPAYFAADIEDYKLANPRTNICIFIDTYEALWQSPYQQHKFFEIDAWIRELISHLPQVLFIIAGREKIRWQELDEDWKYVLDSHILESLSEPDAELFLRRCDINDDDIVSAIVLVSEGSPFYLDLAVDSYMIIKSRGDIPKVSDFTCTTHTQILERFIRYLDRTESTTLKMLALCQHYDIDLFSALVKAFPSGYSIVNFDELNRYSFIQELNSNIFSINSIMKKALQDHTNPGIKALVNRFLFDYHKSRIQDFYTEGTIGFQNFENAKFYASKITLPDEVQRNFYIVSGKIYQYQCQMEKALNAFEHASTLAIGDHSEGFVARIEIATTQRQNGDIEKALQTLDSIKRHCLDESMLTIKGKVLIQEGLCLLSLGQTNKKPDLFNQALGLYKEGVDIAETDKDIPQLIYAKIAISSVLEELGDIKKSISILIECQTLCTQNHLEHTYIDCINGLARKYLKTGDYQQCILLAEEGLELWKKSHFYRGQMVMYCHILNAHHHLNSPKTTVKPILEQAEKLTKIVTETLILHMYQEARKHWSRKSSFDNVRLGE